MKHWDYSSLFYIRVPESIHPAKAACLTIGRNQLLRLFKTRDAAQTFLDEYATYPADDGSIEPIVSDAHFLSFLASVRFIDATICDIAWDALETLDHRDPIPDIMSLLQPEPPAPSSRTASQAET